MAYSTDSKSSKKLPNPKRLKTLAFSVQKSEGNNLLHQFVLDNSDPNNCSSENYINAVLLSMPNTSVNEVNDDGYTALHLAVLKNNLLMVKKLLSCLTNIDINTTCKTPKRKFVIIDVNGTIRKPPIGNTALHLAVKLGHLSIIQELLEKGADVNTKYGESDSALCFAAESGRLDIMKLLINAGAHLNFTCDPPLRSPLHYAAAKSDNLEAVKLLVRSGALVNAIDGNRETALFSASESDSNLETVKLLTSSGADLSVINKAGETVIQIAVKSGSLAVLEHFINSGVDLNAKSRESGDTLLHYSVKSSSLSCQLSCIKLLVSYGADVNAKNIWGMTALHYAVDSSSDYLDVVDLLVRNGADVNVKCKNSYTPLHYAVRNGNVKILGFLINQRAEVNIRDRKGRTLLQHVKYYFENNIKLLDWTPQAMDRRRIECDRIKRIYEEMKVLLKGQSDDNVEND